MGESDFDQFWAHYPKKVGRFNSVSLWLTLSKKDRASALDAIPKHAEFWARSGRTKQMILDPERWLKGRRWEDEIDFAEEIPQTAVAWWTSEEGVIAKGKEIGIFARGGESMQQYKARVVEAARKSA